MSHLPCGISTFRQGGGGGGGLALIRNWPVRDLRLPFQTVAMPGPRSGRTIGVFRATALFITHDQVM